MFSLSLIYIYIYIQFNGSFRFICSTQRLNIQQWNTLCWVYWVWFQDSFPRRHAILKLKSKKSATILNSIPIKLISTCGFASSSDDSQIFQVTLVWYLAIWNICPDLTRTARFVSFPQGSCNFAVRIFMIVNAILYILLHFN